MCEKWFGIPQTAIRLGKIKQLSPVALKLYVALWYESERYSTRELKRTVAQMQTLVGGSRNSYTKARSELARAGLLSADALGTEGFVFHLFNPETGKPWDPDPKRKLIYQRKGSTPQESSQTLPMPKEPPRTLNTGTSFPFGSNDPSLASPAPATEQRHPTLTWDEIGK
jgi:hypothetical protein